MLHFKRLAPLANRVLVRKAEPLQKTKGGIIIADVAKHEQFFGEVVQTGPGLLLNNGVFRENVVKVGQTVLLPGYSGQKIKLADENEYYLYRDDDVIGVLEDPAKI
ncbi:10 kda heat shock mitochondrial-like [Stylonychia lemnae]|uniref:20 kDa chaperonin, chloroplastic n=1 Tax=Stylonychia lemnae TaxID=5949 RepID=A0A078B9G5_STYLE|nr:10 kda heat shock mitochondrial-like [Stylonychia lemnae]|eukprot:CDW91054.1 10 kda heat shock mitochondrial-like [Stylonychia lemnae]